MTNPSIFLCCFLILLPAFVQMTTVHGVAAVRTPAISKCYFQCAYCGYRYARYFDIVLCVRTCDLSEGKTLKIGQDNCYMQSYFLPIFWHTFSNPRSPTPTDTEVCESFCTHCQIEQNMPPTQAHENAMSRCRQRCQSSRGIDMDVTCDRYLNVNNERDADKLSEALGDLINEIERKEREENVKEDKTEKENLIGQLFK